MKLFAIIIALSLAAVGQSIPVKELEQKAEAGDPTAQFQLGLAYEHGDQLTQDYVQAAKWYKLAADRGNSAAQNNLGVMYRMGENFDQNKQTAVDWFRKSAKQGYAPALFNLGAAHYNGEGTTANTWYALAYFYLASQSGDLAGKDAYERTRTELGSLVTDRALYSNLAELYASPDELGPNPDNLVHWLDQAGDYYSLGQMYYYGRQVKIDYAQAAQYFDKAAEKNDQDAEFFIGLGFYEGKGRPQDYASAIHWFNRSAEHSSPEAPAALGLIYHEGKVVQRDDLTAFKWFLVAEQLGNKKVQKNLDELAGQLDKSQQKEAGKQAVKWLNAHTRGGWTLDGLRFFHKK